MPLPALLADSLTRDNIALWAFAHAQDHVEISQATLKQKNVKLPVFQLDPIPQDFKKWLLDHQQAHNDMNAAWSLPGIDISTIDMKDKQAVRAWLFQNFTEHLSVSEAAKI